MRAGAGAVGAAGRRAPAGRPAGHLLCAPARPVLHHAAQVRAHVHVTVLVVALPVPLAALEKQVVLLGASGCSAPNVSPCCSASKCSNVDATPQLGAALQGLLAQVLALTSARRSPIDALLFLEVCPLCGCLLGCLKHRLGAPRAKHALVCSFAGARRPGLPPCRCGTLC